MAGRFQYHPSGIPMPPEAALMAAGGLLGAGMAENRGSPMSDMTRGALKGVGTVGGSLLGHHLVGDSKSQLLQALGIVGGGVGGYLASDRLLKLLGIDVQDASPETSGGSMVSVPAPNEMVYALGTGKAQERAAKELEKEGTLGGLFSTDMALAPKSPVLKALLEAKAESDRGNYTGKHVIMRRLMRQHPDQFQIDSEDKGIVGVTHNPTRFRIHLPRHMLPSGYRLAG